jgi:hypothetical protein
MTVRIAGSVEKRNNRASEAAAAWEGGVSVRQDSSCAARRAPPPGRPLLLGGNMLPLCHAALHRPQGMVDHLSHSNWRTGTGVMSRSPQSAIRNPAFAIALAVFLGAAAVWSADPPPGAGSARAVQPTAANAGPRRPEDDKIGERLREGTRLTDVAGSFQTAGDRISFHPDGGKGESYRVLENLALERVDRFLGQARGTPTWTVSGVVTEFRGSNFLLVTKAMVRTVGEGPTP